MGHGGKPDLVLEIVDQIERSLLGRAPCTVGDRYEGRRKLHQLSDIDAEFEDGRIIPGGEELEGKGGLSASEQVDDFQSAFFWQK